jgi:hypothetical protein
MQTANQAAGPQQPRTTEEASHPQNSNGTTCDDCEERDADGINPNGRSLCTICARRGGTLVPDGGESEDEDDVEVTREMFERGIDALDAAENTIAEFEAELSDVDTGLTHSDTIALLYGRPNDLNKTNIRNGFETLEDLRSKSTRQLLKRLLADQSPLLLKEADAFLDEIERLEQRYGGDVRE